MFFDDMQFDGADSGERSSGIPRCPQRSATPRRSSSSAAASPGSSPASGSRRPGCRSPSSTRTTAPAAPGGRTAIPGARVDIGSHQYCYSFEPTDHWSEYYCQQPELRAYFEGVVEKYGLAPHCRFGTRVVALTWDEPSARWKVTVQTADGSEETLEARFVISAVGALNLPHLPEIAGTRELRRARRSTPPAGPLISTSPATRFALIGAGASGFQIAPTIADRVASLSIFQRTAQWIIPNLMYHAPCRRGRSGRSAICPSTPGGFASS